MEETINKMLTENQEWIDYHQTKLSEFMEQRDVIMTIYNHKNE